MNQSNRYIRNDIPTLQTVEKSLNTWSKILIYSKQLLAQRLKNINTAERNIAKLIPVHGEGKVAINDPPSIELVVSVHDELKANQSFGMKMSSNGAAYPKCSVVKKVKLSIEIYTS